MSDGEKTKIAVANNPIILLKQIADGSLPVSSLSKYQRKLCVKYLSYEGGHTQEEIAAVLNVSPITIFRDLKKINQEFHYYLDEYKHLDSVVSRFIATARRLQNKALRSQDFTLAWKIECDLAAKLQDFGYVHKEPEKFKGDLLVKDEGVDYGSMSREQRAEVRDRLLDRIGVLGGRAATN